MDPIIYAAAEEGNINYFRTSQRHWQCALSGIRTIGRNNVLQVHLKVRERPADTNFMEAIIALDRDLLSERNDAEENAFHTAARAGQHGAVKFLIERGGGVHITVVNKERDTPLHIACRFANLDVVKELLSWNHGVAYGYQANRYGETPLHLAVENACHKNGKSPSHLAFENASYKIVEELIANIPRASQHGNPLIGCALHAAVSPKDEGFLIKIMDVDVQSVLIEFKDSEGQTPLHYAASQGWPEGMRILLNRKPSIVSCRDNKRRTAAHIAAQSNNVDGVQLLVNTHRDCCEALDDGGQNIAHCAAVWGREKVLKYLFEDSRFIDLIHQKDNGGDTPLHLFADSIPRLSNDSVTFMEQNNVISLVKELMINPAYNKDQRTPGDIAAKHMHIISELDKPQQICH